MPRRVVKYWVGSFVAAAIIALFIVVVITESRHF